MTDIPDAISNMDIVYADELLIDFHYQLAKASAADQTWRKVGIPIENSLSGRTGNTRQSTV